MKSKQLKKSILQYAIQGKLVPQDSSEEPAQVLLEKIHQEKQKLIKEKKLKPNKNESTIYKKDGSFYEKKGKEEICIDDQIPFNIPDSWQWARLGSVNILNKGTKKSNEKHIVLDTNFLRKKDNITYKNSGGYVPEGSFIILVDGSNSGEIFKAPCGGYMGSTFMNLSIVKHVDLGYNLLFIKSIEDVLKRSKKGAAIPHLNKSLFNNYLIPIPPLAEQKRIVAKIEEALQAVEKLQQ